MGIRRVAGLAWNRLLMRVDNRKYYFTALSCTHPSSCTPYYFIIIFSLLLLFHSPLLHRSLKLYALLFHYYYFTALSCTDPSRCMLYALFFHYYYFTALSCTYPSRCTPIFCSWRAFVERYEQDEGLPALLKSCLTRKLEVIHLVN
jgi:hypothetical protein